MRLVFCGSDSWFSLTVFISTSFSFNFNVFMAVLAVVIVEDFCYLLCINLIFGAAILLV